MPSFINFLNYLNNNPDSLDDKQKDSLHKLLFCQTNDIFIEPEKISKVLEVKSSFGARILINLKKYLTLNLSITCSSCGLDQEFSNSKFCEHCGEELLPTEKYIFTKINGLLSSKKKLADNEETVRNEQLNQMITLWEIITRERKA